MSFVRTALISAAVLGVVTSGAGLAQTATPEASMPLVGAGAYHYAQAATPESSSKEASTSSKLDDVSKWTTKEWSKAKAKWAKEKEKWADCQKQSKDQKLTGRKSWSFLASCMTS